MYKHVFQGICISITHLWNQPATLSEGQPRLYNSIHPGVSLINIHQLDIQRSLLLTSEAQTWWCNQSNPGHLEQV